MQHLDDGVLNALYDGELTGREAEEATSHLRSCTRCADRFDELHALATEADRLLPALDFGLERTPARSRRIPRLRSLAFAATLVITVGAALLSRAWFRSPSAETTAPTAPPTVVAAPPVGSGQAQQEEPRAMAASPAPGQAAPSPTPPASRFLERGAPVAEGAGLAATSDEAQPEADRAELAQADQEAAKAARSAPEERGNQPAETVSSAFRLGARQVPGAQSYVANLRPALEPALAGAATLLGGRLVQIQGLEPQSVEVRTDSTGGPSPVVVRIRYVVQGHDLWLEQWKGENPGTGRERANPARREAADESYNYILWNDLDGRFLRLTGDFPDSVLAQFRGRVQ